ncbi:MAG: peptidase, partial [Caulobacteraceae bacterium]|nr:peptidase [Caulobacteraceae bacterium]
MGARAKAGAALVMAGLAFGLGAAQAQPPAAARVTAWFGVQPPGPVSDWDKPTFAANPDAYGMSAVRWAKPTPAPLAGPKLMADVNTIVGFARERKLAGDPLWGRISGLPGEPKTVDWAIGRMKAAGIANAHTEEFKIDRPLYVPTKWEVRLVGDAAFGAGTGDVVLQSAMPVAGAKTAAPVSGLLVFVGRGSPAELANVDLKGKIAVVNVVPDGSLFASREKGVAREAVTRGAVGVINAVESPGNLLFFDSRYGCGEAPCFMVGGDDGAFLESVIGKAAAAGKP